MSTPSKPSVQAVTAQIKLKNLRAAAAELKRLEPQRRQFHNFDRLAASVYSPLNNAEKLLFEAHALIPDLVENDPDGLGNANTANRTRVAISKLIKARQIVKDDAEINALLKRCLAALEEAETKVSVAQSHVVRGHWNEAYKNIREAAQFDDSPDVQETNKYITKVYKVHLKDNQQLQSFIKIAKITGFVLAAGIVFAVVYTVLLRDDTNQASQLRVKRTASAQARPAIATAASKSPEPPPVNSPKNAPPAQLAAEEVEHIKEKQPLENSVVIGASEELGASLGPLPVGTQITLRYESGTWCAWQRPNGFSPDQPSEGGRVNCLAIIGIKGGIPRVLKVVGYNTQELPFRYTVTGAYDQIALRINDEPGSFAANDGTVTYNVHITPPAAPAADSK